ncbi:lycopene cyclase [Flavobacterium jejuense]|uniref:Lycopene cyclase n=1 Tax=Flavobacterium jejuense TaxID=1544455 RepID=A0ABX0IPN8_9FLAO|nr:lycopene cyclase family protein [Flavobacterium jejuense]NHN25658.1 lycopene cyclase [Flavobacterium jejuense]
MKHYNYIFTGSGLSALMIVYEMILSGKFKGKSILLLDKDSKKINDRTWCFWDETTLFDSIISKKWQAALFTNNNFKKELKIQPYEYKMIKGIDFYNFVFQEISKHKEISFLTEDVVSFEDLGNQCHIKTEYQEFTADKVFNSIFYSEIVTSQNKYPLLQQHFIGWFIKTKEAVFNQDAATFMDFSIEQKGNTRFMYVLPTSKTEALLEYTLFSKDLLSIEEYEEAIVNYIQKLGIYDYEIIEKEYGNIPMTSYEFWKHNTKNIVNIGSAGGWTKASTGFTFKNATKKSKALVTFLQKDADFTQFYKKDKFWLYDLLFIDVLFKNNALGSKVFSALFKKGNPILIFRFLDEETSFLEDLRVMWKCPKIPFMKALFRRIF